MGVPPLDRAVTRDQTTVLGWNPRPGATVLLAGSANYEDGLGFGSVVRQFDFSAGRIDDGLPGQASCTGPLALGDYDGDGDLDLFVGGQVIPGRYPEPASSILFRNQNGTWEVDERVGELLQGVGMVRGAVWSDLDGDGAPELILACEWGSLRVYHNRDKGQLEEITKSVGLADFTGWWTGVTTGDFDGDGRMDLVAGNWGRNNKYRIHMRQPLRIYFGDLDGNGIVEFLEAYHDEAMGKVVPAPIWDMFSAAMPTVGSRYKDFRSFGQAGVEEILGRTLDSMGKLQVKTLDSMVFWNRVDGFEAEPLPLEAQLAPVFGLSVGDMDGDGSEDLFMSQNFFGVDRDTSRLDAGRGLWLRGDGRGKFEAVAGQVSGVTVYGEGRGTALADYDGDGRIDLVVGQNGGATKLFRNVGAKPGLRIRLRGHPGNPRGVGAVIRLKRNGRLGPSREIHAGSGYWSQDSVVTVIGWQEIASEVWVRWPGGRITTRPIPAGAREISIAVTGKLTVLK